MKLDNQQNYKYAMLQQKCQECRILLNSRINNPIYSITLNAEFRILFYYFLTVGYKLRYD